MQPCLPMIRTMLLASVLASPAIHASAPTTDLPSRGPAPVLSTQGKVDSVDAARGLVRINRVEYLFDTKELKVRGSANGLPKVGAVVTFKVIAEGKRQRITDMESNR